LNKKSFQIKARIFDSITVLFLLSVLTYVIQNPTESDLLDLKVNSLLVLAFLCIGFLSSWLLSTLKVITWGDQIFKPHHEKSSVASAWYKSLWGWQAVLFLVLSLAVGFVVTRFSFYELSSREGIKGALRLFREISSPDWAILPRAVTNIVETVFMAFIATALAFPVAFILSFLSSRNIMKSPWAFTLYLFLRTFFNIVRSVEALIWAIIFSVWVGIGPFAGMLALMVHSVASLAKQYSEIVESTGDGPVEGILATGAGPFQVVWYGIVPQIILPFISFTIYRWDINVRMATIIGLVGGGGIGTLLIQYQGQAMWSQVGCIIVVIAIVVWLLDQASAYIREALK
jgi:phosphonate transport system permease protein